MQGINFDNSFMRFFNKAMDVVILNVIFVICCLPIVTIGAAYSALYYSLMKSIRRDRGYVYKNYFKAFIQNLKQGIPAFLILGFFEALAVYGMYLLRTANDGGASLGFWFSIFVFIVATFLLLYMFPVISRFSFPFKSLFAFCTMISFRYVHYTIGLAAMLLGIGYLGYLFPPAAVLILPALYALLSSFLIERIFKVYMKLYEEEPSGDGEEEEFKDTWYLE